MSFIARFKKTRRPIARAPQVFDKQPSRSAQERDAIEDQRCEHGWLIDDTRECPSSNQHIHHVSVVHPTNPLLDTWRTEVCYDPDCGRDD